MSRSQSDQTLRLNTFTGGVSTKPFTKRLPNEVSVLDNAVVTLENNLEKRPGLVTAATQGLQFPSSKATDPSDNNFLPSSTVVTTDTCIISVDNNSDIFIFDGAAGNLIKIVEPDADQRPDGGDKDIKDKLIAVTVFDGTFLLNTEVEAKYDNSEQGVHHLYQG